MKAWKRVEPTEVQQIGWRTIVTKTFELPYGKQHHYQLVDAEGKQNTGVIALTPDGRIIIARQFRPGPEKIMDELPGGIVEPGETSEMAARRELREETGYEAGEMRFLGGVYKDAYTNTIWNYFLATGCRLTATGPDPDEHEHIETRLVSVAELITIAKAGKMTDSPAILLAYDQLQGMVQS